MSELPPGWVHATVGELAASAFDGPFGSNLKTVDYVASGVRVVRLENIGRLQFISEKQTYIDKSKYEALRRHTLAPNDVLFSSFIEDRTRVCLFPEEEAAPAINKADCFCIRVNASVCDPRLLVLALATDEAHRQLSGEIHGATRPRIGLRDLLALQLGLPPLAEQRRIVAKIDALTARSKRARAELRRTRKNLERLKKTLLNKALRASSSCVRRNLESVAAKVPYATAIGPFGSNLVKSDYRPSGVRLIFVRDIRAEDFSERTAVYIEAAKASKLRAHAVRPGDVLVTKMGDPPGDAAIYPDDGAPGIITSDCIKITPDASVILGRYLLHCIRSEDVQAQVQAITKGVAQQKVSLKSFREIRLPVPPLDEQRAIVARIETAFAALDRVEAEARAAERALDRLDQAILAKAFRGELVPQDPADEPASALLARIATDRATAPKPARVRRRTAA